jgi:hypothetical protein
MKKSSVIHWSYKKYYWLLNSGIIGTKGIEVKLNVSSGQDDIHMI